MSSKPSSPARSVALSESKTQSPEVVHVAGLDFDGCAHYKGQPGNSGRTHWQLMTADIHRELKATRVRFVFDMSSRNNEFTELVNMSRGAGASFTQFESLPALYMRLDKSTMEDLWLDQKPGTTFDRVRDWAQSNNIIADLASDEDVENKRAHEAIEAKMKTAAVVPSFKCKIALVYAHLLRARYLVSRKPVVYHVYDDSIDVLSGLYDFYRDNRHLIPSGVTLRLHQVTLSAERADDGTPKVTGEFKNGFSYRPRDADGNRPKSGEEKLAGEACLGSVMSNNGYELETPTYISLCQVLIEAMKAVQPRSRDSQGRSLDGCEDVFVRELQRRNNILYGIWAVYWEATFNYFAPAHLKSLTKHVLRDLCLYKQKTSGLYDSAQCPEVYAVLDSAMTNYLLERAGSIPCTPFDPFEQALLIHHSRRADGHSFGDKLKAVIALKYALRVQTEEAFQLVRTSYQAPLSRGQLGQELAAAIRNLATEQRPTSRCLFPSSEALVKAWLGYAEQNLQEPVAADTETASGPGNGGGGGSK